MFPSSLSEKKSFMIRIFCCENNKNFSFFILGCEHLVPINASFDDLCVNKTNSNSHRGPLALTRIKRGRVVKNLKLFRRFATISPSLDSRVFHLLLSGDD
jgi:hypothetical protein